MPQKQKPMNEKEKSHWAGQFFAAGELVRRGYWTSFTVGNVPSTDLLVMSPKGLSFKIEVKTKMRKQFSWWIKNPLFSEDRFYVLVVSETLREGGSRKKPLRNPDLWIMTSQEIRDILRKREREGKGQDQVYKSDMPEDSRGWEKLPS